MNPFHAIDNSLNILRVDILSGVDNQILGTADNKQLSLRHVSSITG
jgi:hypothetical protein